MSVRPDAAVVVIPARYGSTRLPAKALAEIGGKPMVVRVYERAKLAKTPETVIVATDSDQIRSVFEGGADVRLTDPEHPSGTDRVAEVARGLDHGIVVNVQGDLPLLDPDLVDALVATLRERPELAMATVAVEITDDERLHDPSVVKVVCAVDGRALYFSRAPIPHDRDRDGTGHRALHHVGLYAYRRATLLGLAELPPTPLERTEKLEQLRALENGIVIGVLERSGPPPMEVDTAGDLSAVRTVVESDGSGARKQGDA